MAQRLHLASDRVADVFPLEEHFTAQQIAAVWNVDATTVQRIFADEPGVLKLGKTGRRGKRDYVTLRIPKSVKAVREAKGAGLCAGAGAALAYR